MSETVRLQRFLATAGVAARRKAEEMITGGRVTVNGKIVTVLGTKVDPDNDSVNVDGESVYPLDKFYVLLNKPKACITAVTDDRGRSTVMDYLPNVPVPVKPVGRLDFYTEGVLLLTNDGELAAKLLAPASHVAKTYHAKVHGQVTQDQLKVLRRGVELEDGTVTQPAEAALLPSESKYSWVAVTIHEGKHHQVHRMFEALGFVVDKLQRVAFANLTFHHLRVGDARELSQQELNELRDAVGLDHSAVARGRWRASREATDIPRRARAKARAEAEEVAALAGHALAAEAGRDDNKNEDENEDGDAALDPQARDAGDPGSVERGSHERDDEDSVERPAVSRPPARSAARPKAAGTAGAGAGSQGARGGGGTGGRRSGSWSRSPGGSASDRGRDAGPRRDGNGRDDRRAPGVRSSARGDARGSSGGRDDRRAPGVRSSARRDDRGASGGRTDRGVPGRSGGEGDRAAGRSGFGSRDDRGGSKPGFGGRDQRGATKPRFGGRDERGAAKPGFGGRDQRGATKPGFGGRDQRGAAKPGFGGRGGTGGTRGAAPSRDDRKASGGGSGFGRVDAPNKRFAKRADEGRDERAGAAGDGTDGPAKRGGQGRSFGKRGARR
ncbi:MAG: pseudouridine synthase [Kofleriaceae bacterium]